MDFETRQMIMPVIEDISFSLARIAEALEKPSDLSRAALLESCREHGDEESYWIDRVKRIIAANPTDWMKRYE